MGYEPNFQASNLASHNSRTIGIILPVFVKEAYENSFYLEAIRGISQFCNQRQYINTVITGQDENEILQVIKSMTRSGQETAEYLYGLGHRQIAHLPPINLH